MIAASGFVVGGGRTLRLGGARKARPLGPSSLRSRFDSSAAAADGGDDKDTLRGAVVGPSARGARHFRRCGVFAHAARDGGDSGARDAEEHHPGGDAARRRAHHRARVRLWGAAYCEEEDCSCSACCFLMPSLNVCSGAMISHCVSLLAGALARGVLLVAVGGWMGSRGAAGPPPPYRGAGLRGPAA